MKRIMASLVALSFLFALAAFAPVRASELEKIPSPDQIKHYREIIKREGSLYGVRANVERVKKEVAPVAATANATGTAVEASAATDDKLEKIAAPSLISLYEKIRKVGTALWGIKKKKVAEKTASASALVTAAMADCVAAAISAKDQSLSARLTATAASLGTAIAERTACQQAAIKSTEGQREALKLCVKNFQTKHQQINSEAKKAHREIWAAYQAGLKNCRPAASVNATSTAETAAAASSSSDNSEIIIEDGSEDLSDSVTDISAE